LKLAIIAGRNRHVVRYGRSPDDQVVGANDRSGRHQVGPDAGVNSGDAEIEGNDS
jgi:hypothetical protein